MIHPKLASSLPQAGLVLIAGDIRSGKSALAYGLMEAMHERSASRPAHVFGFPGAKAHLLPDWISPVEDPEFPDDSIVIADEAYRRFYSRESMSDSNKLADQFAGLVGQKGIMAIYVTQTARKLEIALVSGAQVFLLKKPSRLMVLLDRSALRPLLSRAFESFEASRCPPAEATYVVSDPFEGFLEYSNSPPSFWSEDLSRVWKGVALAGTGGEATISRDDVYRELNRLAVECWDDNKVLREVVLKAVDDIDVGSWESAVATLDAGVSLAGPLRAKLERLRDGARGALDKWETRPPYLGQQGQGG